MHARMIDLTGARIGKLTVVKPDGFKQTASGARQYFWTCKCECGKECRIDGCCLRRASTKSCGCTVSNYRHGMANHPLYSVWLGMKQRCLNKNHKNYQDYGGRGVKICQRWLESVANLHADMGDRPTSKHTIERRNNAGDYEPENCYWATRAEQNENTRQTRLLTFQGKTLSVGKWAKALGMGRKTLTSRIDRLGWSVEKALSTPVATKR